MPEQISDAEQMREIAREFGRLETRIRRAGLKNDAAKAARSRQEIRAFAESLLRGDFGPLA